MLIAVVALLALLLGVVVAIVIGVGILMSQLTDIIKLLSPPGE
jgi:hypothetical protein